MASLAQPRRLVANFHDEEIFGSTGRLAGFLELAERHLASREAALSADGLEQRFEKNKLFGDDDDHAASRHMATIERLREDTLGPCQKAHRLSKITFWCYCCCRRTHR